MLQCPACDTNLNQDFGMVTCQKCGAVLIVEISGDVRMNTDGENSNFDEQKEITSQKIRDEDLSQSQEFEKYPETVEDTIQELQNEKKDNIEQSMVESSFEETPDNDKEKFNNQNDFENQDSDINNESSFQEHFFESQPFKEDLYEDAEKTIYSEIKPQEESIVKETEDENFQIEEETNENTNPESDEDKDPPSQPDSTPVDITAFANSEVSNMDNGEYLYDLTINHLDSKDLREALKEILTDKKLKINHNDFIKKIKNGRVCIPDLNPVKAKKIVEQLQFYDLRIHWKQKRVVMEETFSEEEEIFNEETGGDDV